MHGVNGDFHDREEECRVQEALQQPEAKRIQSGIWGPGSKVNRGAVHTGLGILTRHF